MGVSAVDVLDIGVSAASPDSSWAPANLALVVPGNVSFCAHSASWSVSIGVLLGDMSLVAARRAHCIWANFDEVIGFVLSASKLYAHLDYPALLFLTGDGEFYDCCLLSPLRHYIYHCRWR